MFFNEGDFQKAFATLAPDVEWHLLPGLPETGVLRGREAVIHFFAGTRDALNWQVHAQDFRLVGPGRVFVHQRGTSVGRTSKIGGTGDFFQIWEIDTTGLTVRVLEFNDRNAALEAAGRSEQAMSQEKLKVIEGAYEAVRRRRVAEWAQAAAPPELEWHPAPESPDYEVRRGPQGVTQYFDQVLENAMVWEPRIIGITQAGSETYVIAAEATAESRHGISTEFKFAQVWDFDGDRPIRVREFLHHAQALEAAGLRE